MLVCFECCVLSGRGLCEELITRPEESYRLWCVVVCDLETSWMRRPWPTGGCCAKKKKEKIRRTHLAVKTKDELDELIRHKNIINQIKAQRLSWFGHLHRMPEERIVKKKVCKWKPMLTRPLGRPKNRWEDDIRNDMKKLKIKNWTSCIQDRNKWKLYVENAKTFKELSCNA